MQTYESGEVIVIIIDGDLEVKLSQQVVQVVPVNVCPSSRWLLRHFVYIDNQGLTSWYPHHTV